MGKIRSMKSFVAIETGLEWQWPATTEKQAMERHRSLSNCAGGKAYVAFPWASAIDFIAMNLPTRSYDYMEDERARQYLLGTLGLTRVDAAPELHTVCQSIHWGRLVGLWKFMGINHVHVCHLRRQDDHEGMTLLPWRHAAPNREFPGRDEGLVLKPTKEKKHLCSFIGAYNKLYKRMGSDIRERLGRIVAGADDVVFELKERWFYEDIVYGAQARGMIFSDDFSRLHREETARYNSVLSDSVFSLCPYGTGPNTLRLWESMSVGSIPVLFESDWVRPSIDGLDWDSFSITIEDGSLGSLIDTLKGVSESKIESMREACLDAYERARNRTCF